MPLVTDIQINYVQNNNYKLGQPREAIDAARHIGLELGVQLFYFKQ